MPNSSRTTEGSRRGGPTFKFYWVENGRIVAIKRYDEAEATVVPYRVFKLISFVFPDFKVDEHVVKFQDDSDLIELTKEDCVRFNAESGDMQVYLYIFSSKEEASRTVSASSLTSSNTPRFVAPSTPVKVTVPTPMVTDTPQVQATVTQPQVAKPQVEVTQQSQAGQPEASQQANPETNRQSEQSPSREAGDAGLAHAHVVCDGCNSSIPTHRYKCLQCPDFDLCAACEAKGLHPEHLMVRVSVPFVEAYGVAHREILHRVLSAASREFSDDIVIDLGKQLKDVLGAFGIELDHIGEGKHCDGRRKHGHGFGHGKGKHGHCPFGPFSGFDKKEAKQAKKAHRREMREEARANQAMESDSTPSAPSAPFAESTPAPPAPFDPTPTLIPNPAHVPVPAPAPVAAQPAPAPAAPNTTVTDSPVYPTLDSVEVVPMEEDSPRAGEWLMVDSDGAAAPATTGASTRRMQESSLPFLHSDDVANVALEKLAMMGYRIDDPLLVNLVEECKGDITRILDCLHG